jgi:hypothetical protein
LELFNFLFSFQKTKADLEKQIYARAEKYANEYDEVRDFFVISLSV